MPLQFCANKAAETPQRNQLCVFSIEPKIVEALEQHYLLSSQPRVFTSGEGEPSGRQINQINKSI